MFAVEEGGTQLLVFLQDLARPVRDIIELNAAKELEEIVCAFYVLS